MQDQNPADNSKQAPFKSQPPKGPLVAWASWLAFLLVTAVAGVLLRRAGFTPLNLSIHDWPILAAMLVWVLFAIYWEAAAKNAAPAKDSESSASRRLHLAMLSTAQVLIFFPVFGLRQRYLPSSHLVTATGLALELICLLLAVWARQCLGRYWSGKIAIKVDHVLVQQGPYRLLRHPIYTALLGMYAGVAIVWGELHSLIGLAIAVLAYLRKVRLEEASLAAAFAAEYSDYRRKTWALFPGIY
jgi:protein-S-isoprenylcysteine O-methyltransferase Ste14